MLKATTNFEGRKVLLFYKKSLKFNDLTIFEKSTTFLGYCARGMWVLTLLKPKLVIHGNIHGNTYPNCLEFGT